MKKRDLNIFEREYVSRLIHFYCQERNVNIYENKDYMNLIKRLMENSELSKENYKDSYIVMNECLQNVCPEISYEEDFSTILEKIRKFVV